MAVDILFIPLAGNVQVMEAFMVNPYEKNRLFSTYRHISVRSIKIQNIAIFILEAFQFSLLGRDKACHVF